MTKISRIKLVEEAIDLCFCAFHFLEYRDAHGFSEEQAKDKAIAEIQEYEVLEFDSTEQDREIAEAREEGIEEIKSKLREHAKWKLHAIASTGEWREGYKAAIEWVISNVEYAERLKEKGK